MKFLSLLTAAALFVLPGLGHAENILAKDATTLARFFETEGVEFEVTTDDVGDPKLKVDYYGNDFSIYFYGCENNKNCDAIQFFSGYQTDGGIRVVKINEWNTENRFGRAYISDEGSARVELDVYLGNTGMNPDDFAELLGYWSRIVQDFEEFINW
ncbi:YbjN domain-containing protein [Phaeobacter gallaeciensis]|uniref:YbjN domain-containing protein n=1 Tax=Phaeobacter gallaeciensis TaxID=60890 RepID=UPI000BBCA8BC|nr:YbjN domain-containing protein [Phaeobacter gallaeciensis]ATF16870.1 Putative bacterial sensory transduction regulator [Phaeobacter gallaeciensis]ATF20979.1 Putative bacterial sensory transduction regulator [Phaeobacter gallaeciensis]